jgi:hypothetical protein
MGEQIPRCGGMTSSLSSYGNGLIGTLVATLIPACLRGLRRENKHPLASGARLSQFLPNAQLCFFIRGPVPNLLYRQDDLQEESVMQATLAQRPRPATLERADLSALAREKLEHHPHFRGRLSGLQFEQFGKTLRISGRLPSFYLKQLIQETLRHLPGVQNVDNDIDVVRSDGLSSV